MTLSSLPSTSDSHDDKKARLTRRVSSLSPLEDDISESSEGSRSLKRIRLDGRKYGLARQVSSEGFALLRTETVHQDENAAKLPSSGISQASPIRCVSDFDKVSYDSQSTHAIDYAVEDKLCAHSLFTVEGDSGFEGSIIQTPYILNPIHNENILNQHEEALRLEAELHPMRLILSRIMAHHVLNRKGIFNKPVDPVALGIPDYFDIVKRPMDFGTIKDRLHSNVYTSVVDVTEDMRLVLLNAMTYNPPGNVVHISAKDLLHFFEEQLLSFLPELSQPPEETFRKIPARSALPLTGKVAPSYVATDDGASVATEVNWLYLPQPKAVSGTFPLTTPGRKRMKRGSKKIMKDHSCQWCKGRNCTLCNQGCLSSEPTLLICNGANCAGSKIRKGAIYYISPEGNCQYCQRCYAGLPAVLPQHSVPSGAQIEHDHDDSTRSCRYKRNLLKRKNDEEVVEEWLVCGRCQSAVHKMCAMYNELTYKGNDYFCPHCVLSSASKRVSFSLENSQDNANSVEMYTFITGSNKPIKLSDLSGASFYRHEYDTTAERLPETEMSSFIERKVRNRIAASCHDNEEMTITVRVISDVHKSFKVPDVIRKHFKMNHGSNTDEEEGSVTPPEVVNYRSKAITLFQKVDGLDVCIFCMYVHEYDGDEETSSKEMVTSSSQKRVYIAYLDSVEHLRPRHCRTQVYYEILVAYLATARARGYESAHIWACPPSRGNSFVFWNHPSSQRTPTMERLLAWYHGAIARAVDLGVVSNVMSLYESDFEHHFKKLEQDHDGLHTRQLSDGAAGLMVCPPLLEGDFWVEEAVRVHGVHMNRQIKTKSGNEVEVEKILSSNGSSDPCPAIQVASMMRDKILAHPSSLAFRRPVNAAAMKLKDYHTIIQHPMDLGTVYSKTVLGEYRNLDELVEDVNLVFTNAKKYNPPGNIVHLKAIEVEDMFFQELNSLTRTWYENGAAVANAHSWKVFHSLSMRLDRALEHLADDILPPLDSGKASFTFDHPSSTDKRQDSSLKNGSMLVERAKLIGGGPDAVQCRMVGSDKWLLDKKNPNPPKEAHKKSSNKKRKGAVDSSSDEGPAKRRRQSWLGEEVGAAVRRMRESFFTCCLKPRSGTLSVAEEEKEDAFKQYIAGFDIARSNLTPTRSSKIADARHSFLEFSQFHRLEFDTLRKAKYSSSIILYHLHHDDAPGTIPKCTDCNGEIQRIRWHRINKVIEQNRKPVGRAPACRKQCPTSFEPQELCASCHSNQPKPDEFIPLPVSFLKVE